MVKVAKPARTFDAVSTILFFFFFFFSFVFVVLLLSFFSL
jgi:hypothetical protein